MSFPHRVKTFNKTAHDIAIDTVSVHNKLMEGKKLILVPHPTVSKTWIEKIVDNNEKN